MKDAKQKLFAAQLNVLVHRLQSGKPLTAEQMKFVESQFNKATNGPTDEQTIEQADAATANDVCESASQLAQRLGIHRQTITYHRQLGNAPGTLSESAWRKYLQDAGKMPTAMKLHKSAESESKFDTDTSFAILFNELSDGLLKSVKTSLSVSGVKLSSRKVDDLVWGLWILLAAIYQRVAREHGADGPFDPIDDTGKCEYPDEIKKLAARFHAANPGDKQAVPPAPEVMKN